jgi:predicted DCC family thiol-disulfide oxidoreductase YuxK
VRKLTVLFDADCALCRRARRWLAEQPAYVALEFVPARSEEARRRFPGLDHEGTLANLTVVADDGGLYRADRAWVMCLWALRRYRALALRLRSGPARRLARRVVDEVSRHRYRISSMLERSEEQVESKTRS